MRSRSPDQGKQLPFIATPGRDFPANRSGTSLAMRAPVLKKCTFAALFFGLALIGASTSAFAQTLGPQQRMCDPTFEDCRADILTYIQQETVEIDMGFWMMTDARYSNALVAAWQRGVKIRVLMDPGCVTAH